MSTTDTCGPCLLSDCTHRRRNRDFEKYVKQEARRVLTPDRVETWYISKSSLEKYWQDSKFAEVLLEHDPPIPLSEKDIRGSFLRVWSILVWIMRPEYIKDFIEADIDDANLHTQRDVRPHDAIRSPAFDEVLNKFRDYRWHFTPVQFLSDRLLNQRKLDNRTVLPVEYQDTLTPPTPIPTTLVRRVLILDDCTDFSHQNSKLVNILEYANGGSLLDMFMGCQPPQNLHEVGSLWTALLSLCKGIYVLHNIWLSTKGHVGCAHRDIKPSNILVFRKNRPYDITLKLTDFDTTSSLQRISKLQHGKQDNNGSRTYCSPEASRVYPEEETSEISVPLNGDVWSLGCVLSEVLVWLAEGQDGLQKYLEKRKAETSYTALKGSGYEACFHNRDRPLDCVSQAHNTALLALEDFDTFSPKMKELIEQRMLVSAAERGDPMDIWRHFDQTIKGISNPVSSKKAGLDIDTTAEKLDEISEESTEPSTKPVPNPPAIPSHYTESSQPDGNIDLQSPPPNATNVYASQDGNSTMQLNPHPMHAGLLAISQSSNPFVKGGVPDTQPSRSSGGSQTPHDIEKGANTPIRLHNEGTSSLHEASAPPASPIRQLSVQPIVVDSTSTASTRCPDSASAERAADTKRIDHYPFLSILDIEEWRKGGKRSALKGIQNVAPLLRGRRQIFVIDDSRNMRVEHGQNVIKTAGVLMYLAKKFRHSGIEMCFTSEPEKRYQGFRWFRPATKHLVEKLRHHFFNSKSELCNMEEALNQVFLDARRARRQLSITVLTDGAWKGCAQEPGGGVERAIKKIVSYERLWDMAPTDITVQFVRFGDDPGGVSRLQYLHENLKEDKEMHG
ncbi:kinase-like protein [Thozetella sp. PMI_491]|nr:kinase-like protein [Thozetella sp. PMI_491]